MLEKILVALDGSQHSLRAAEYASWLAAKFGSELHLLTVTRPPKVSPAIKRFLEAENLLGEPKYVLDEMTREIFSQAKKVAEESGVAKVKTAVREGKPARTIVEYAKNNDIDLIVLGGRGLAEADPVLLGSVSEKVSLLCDRPCLLVK